MIYTVTLNPALDKTVEIPSFTPGCVNRITSVRTDPGGKGINVSKGIQQLGGTGIACGILGGHTGEIIRAALAEMGLETLFVFAEGETRTNLKISDPVSHENTDINESGFAVPRGAADGLLRELTGRIMPGDLVVLSGSLPKGLPAETYADWIRALKARGAKTFLDADGEALVRGIDAAPYLIKPNHLELAGYVGRELPGIPERRAAAKEILGRTGIRRVVVSMGSEGLLFVGREVCLYTEGLRVPVKSTVGAGDSTVAALAWAEERGMSPEETVRLAAAAGAASVMCSGSQPPTMGQIRELLPGVRVRRLM